MEQVSVIGLDGNVHHLEMDVLEQLHGTIRGEILLPDSDGYHDVRQLWNGLHDKCPGLIIRCSGVADVIDGVNFAREHGLLLSIRGGGHNVAGTGSCDNGIMLDLSNLREVRVDPSQKVADVSPGALLGDMDRETQAFGLVAPAGIVSTTGVAGLTLAGGMGWLRRKYGLTIDNLEEVDIVTADGTFRRASESENPDLFWALRGGGGNFGVVTRFRYRLQELGPLVYLAAAFYPAEEGIEAIEKWRDFCDEAPDEISSFAVFLSIPPGPPFPEELWGRPACALLAIYAGSLEEGESALAPLREMGNKMMDLSGPIPFTMLQCMFDAQSPAGGRYYWKTITVNDLNRETIETVVDLGRTRTSPKTVIGIWQMGGAVSRVPDDATGYGPRSDKWTVALDAAWIEREEDETHITSIRDGWSRLRTHSNGGMYIHYGEIDREEQMREAYGPIYDRLAEVKRKYDPMNLFRVNQNIRPLDMAAEGEVMMETALD